MVVLKREVLLFLLLFVRRCLMLGSKVIQDKMEIASYDKNYIENPKIALFNYNGSPDIKAFNLSYTLKQDLPDVVVLHIQMYRLANKEYHTFPLNFTGDICPYFTQDSPQLQNFLDHSNIKRCPFKKGFYYVNSFVGEQHKVPPYIPTGSYMAEATTMVNKNVNLWTTRSYARIT